LLFSGQRWKIIQMITITPTGLNVSVNGPVVYLDNWAIIEFAKKDPVRRQRFIHALHSGVDLLFSATNAAELSGPQGWSAQAVRDFLDQIGPHWFPARLDATEVVRQELKGVMAPFVDRDFFESLISYQVRRQASDVRNVIPISRDLLCLTAVLDWVGPQRDSISKTSAEFDDLIKKKMTDVHGLRKRDPASFEQKFPAIAFDPARPASFVYHNMLRVMAIEPNSLKKGDGMDFCHAVVSFAFSTFAAIDTHWKRRLAHLPPNRLARVYSHADLDRMITDMEVWLEHVGH
jgi:hypothetical protein